MWNFHIIRGFNGTLPAWQPDVFYASLSYASSGQSNLVGIIYPWVFLMLKTNVSGPKLADTHSEIAPFNNMYE